MLVDEVDEVHGFGVEAEETDPFLEVEMLLLDLLDDRGKEILHFLLKGEELGYLCVWVFADNVL